MVFINKKIRVLVADDSFFMRKLIKDILESDEAIEVVGTAKDGEEAVSEALRLKPDVITMDYMMPRMDGAQATYAILSQPGNLPAIIMISAYTQPNVKATFDSLRAGVTDIIEKSSGDLSLDIDKKKDEIITKVKAVAYAKIQKHGELIPSIKKANPSKNITAKIIVIGASTGGPPVVENIIIKLPEGLKSTILVVQHMPSNFTKIFADRLSVLSVLPVKEANNHDHLNQGDIFVAAGGFHLTLENREQIVLKTTPENTDFCPSIDVTMKSAVEKFGNHCVGIVLTGMGNDGFEGAKAIKEAGGYVIAQTPETCVVDSMPNHVIRAGLADEVLSPNQIVRRIIKLSK